MFSAVIEKDENIELIEIVARVLSLAGILALLLCLAILAATPPAVGYELSIYGAYPLSFWFLVVFANAAGIVLLVIQATRERSSVFSLCGVVFILLTNFIVVVLPLLRGYTFYGVDDALYHLGFVNVIISSGHLSSFDFEAASHLFVVLTSFISNLPQTSVLLATEPIMWLVYIVGGVLLVRMISRNQAQALLIFALISELPIGLLDVKFYPVGASFLLLPFALYAYLRSPRPEFRFVFLVFALAMVFTHSFAALALILILVIHTALALRYSRNREDNHRSVQGSMTAILIVSLAFAAWFSAAAIYGARVHNLLAFLSGASEISQAAQLQIAASKASLLPVDYALLILKTYGQTLIYVLLFALGVALVFRIRRAKRNGKLHNELFFGATFVILIVVFFALFISGLAAFGSPYRVAAPALFFCAVFIGLTYHKSIFNIDSKHRRLYLSVFTAALVISSALGMFTVHLSPWMGTASQDVSDSEWTGALFVATNSKIDTRIYSIGIALGPRARDIVYGPVASGELYGVMSPHFGYNESTFSVADHYNQSIITLTDEDLLYYRVLWPTQGSFNSTDFEMLSNDHAAELFYSNGGGMSLYYVEG